MGNDNYVYLEPMINKVKQLSIEGVVMFDAYTRETFVM